MSDHQKTEIVLDFKDMKVKFKEIQIAPCNYMCDFYLNRNKKKHRLERTLVFGIKSNGVLAV